MGWCLPAQLAISHGDSWPRHMTCHTRLGDGLGGSAGGLTPDDVGELGVGVDVGLEAGAGAQVDLQAGPGGRFGLGRG